MKIYKTYEVESAHIVRNCTSERCSHSIHGHSAKIEVCLESKGLDNAQMVYDFGLMKNSIKELIDSMDHSYLLCSKDNPEFQKFVHDYSDRVITFNFNPTAEMLALFLLDKINDILVNTRFSNGEKNIICSSVKYWETRTGCAEATLEDSELICILQPTAKFSSGIQKDWKDLKEIMEDKPVVNPVIEQQITL